MVAALPASTISARAATFGVAAAKGGTTAKAAAASGLLGAILAPALGLLGNYIGYRIGMDGAQSEHEREHIRSFYRKLSACVFGFLVAYCLLMIWANQFIRDHHLVYNSLILGLVLPFNLIVFANGIFWLRSPRKFLAELAAKGVTVNPASPAWEYRSKFVLLGLPFIHVRVRGGLTAPVTPVKAWIAASDYAVGLLFAFGHLAVAPVSIGALPIGLLSFGGCAVGLLSLGGFSFGIWSFGVLAFGWQAFGCCAIAWNAANGGAALTYHLDAQGSVEVGAEVSEPFAGNERVHCSQLPAGTAVTTVHFGSYALLSNAHAAIREWCVRHGHRCLGVSWEIYGHWEESWNTDSSKIRTDVFYLLSDSKG